MKDRLSVLAKQEHLSLTAWVVRTTYRYLQEPTELLTEDQPDCNGYLFLECPEPLATNLASYAGSEKPGDSARVVCRALMWAIDNPEIRSEFGTIRPTQVLSMKVAGEGRSPLIQTWRIGEVAGNIFFKLKLHLNECPGAGRVAFTSGIPISCDSSDCLEPNVSVLGKLRLAFEAQTTTSALVPDLCVEVLSNTNSRSDVFEKLGKYFDAGAKVLWVADPEECSVRVYEGPLEGRVLHQEAFIDGGDVLPGFSCPVADFFK